MTIAAPLVDQFGRAHTDLRVSVTDRCNIRCHYCMPATGIVFRPHPEILTFEEIERFVRIAAGLGVNEVRLTGGEPLVRRGIVRLVAMLAAVPGIADLAMTTNGILLPQFGAELKDAGLRRLNISLDTLDRDRFQEISRRDELPRVLEGIAAALEIGFDRIKLNAVAVRGQSERDIVPLARFARKHGLELRFIEFMPLDGDDRWSRQNVLPGEVILQLLTADIGPLEPLSDPSDPAPASTYRYLDGGGTVGVIPTVSQPFCDRCSRLRLTADGKIRNCLFGRDEFDARGLIRSGGSDEQLVELIRNAVGAKRRQHGSDDGDFSESSRIMHQIGG